MVGYIGSINNTVVMENCELHQQVSLLSQWNDKNQRAINTLEQQLENIEEEKRKCLLEMEQMQSYEQVRL